MLDPVPLGAFDLLRPLGRGATGKVWYGIHRPSGTPVAVKTLRPSVAEKGEPLFEREARAIASLDHPHIVALLDYGRVPDDAAERSRGALTTDAPFLVMEHVSGGSCWERPPQDQEELGELLSAILAALGHAHSRGVLHRDVKPGNILWSGGEDLRQGPRLVDFGIAWFARSATVGPVSVGTPSYMAPEQLTGDLSDLGPWTDLYAFAALAWQLACRTPPAREDSHLRLLRRKMERDFDAWAPAFAVPAGLEGCLRTALAPDPGDRPSSAAELAAMLAELEWPQAPPPRPTGRAPQLQGAGLATLALRPAEPVGRDVQAAVLDEALERVEEHGGIEVVTLEAGPELDALALVRQFCDASEEAGRCIALRLDGRESDLPTTVLRRLTRSAELEGEALTRRVRRYLQVRGEDSELAVEVLADLLRSTASADTLRHVERERRVIVARTVALEAGFQPVIVVLSGAVGFGRGLARQLVRLGRIEDLAVLLLVLDPDAAEPGSLAPLLDHPRRTRLTLTPLPGSAMQALADALVPLRAPLRARLVERAQGRPEVLREEIVELASSGALISVGGRYRLAPGVDLPARGGTRAQTIARLQSVAGVEGRAIAELLALLDGPCPAGLLEEAASSLGLRPERTLTRLARAGLVERVRGRWRLRSGELQASLRGGPAAGELAEALLQARGARIPAEWRAKLLEVAGRDREALALRIRVVAARDRRADHERFELELAVAVERVQELDLDPQDPDRLAVDLLVIKALARRGEEELQTLAEELALRAEAADAHAVAGEAWRQISVSRRSHGRPNDALPSVERAAAAFERAGDVVGLARAWHTRGLALRELARYDEALASMLRAADAAEPLDPLVAARALSDRADLLQWVTRWDEAAADIARCLAIGAEAEDVQLRRVGRTEQLQLLIARSRFEEARQLANTLIRDFRYLGAGSRLAGVLMLAGEVHRFVGELDRAEDLYRQTQAIYDDLGSPMAMIARANLAIVDYLRGRIDDSFDDLDALYDEAAGGQIRWLADPMRLARAPAAAALGRWDLVDEVLDALENQARLGDRMDLDAVWVARELARLAPGSGDAARHRRLERLITVVERRLA